jgi:hypothetical protein
MSEQRHYDLAEAKEIMARAAEEFLPDYEGKRKAGQALMTELQVLDGFCGYVVKPGVHGLWFGVSEGHEKLGLWITEGVGADLFITIPGGKGRSEKIPGLVLNRLSGLLEGEDSKRSGAAVVVEYVLAVIRRERQSLVIRSPSTWPPKGTPPPK